MYDLMESMAVLFVDGFSLHTYIELAVVKTEINNNYI